MSFASPISAGRAHPQPPSNNHPLRLTRGFARAAVAAPVLSVFAIAVGAPLYTDDLADAATTSRLILANAVTLGVLLLLTLALVGLYLHGQRQLGAPGQAAFTIALLGTVLASGGAWDSLFALPYIATKAPTMLDDPTGGSLLVGFLVSYLILVIGWTLIAIASMRARIITRAASVVIIAGSVFALAPTPTAIRLLPLTIGIALAGRTILRSPEPRNPNRPAQA